ncbi:MAG TPA: hypothetical protein VK673_21870 [Chthoniobacterales bacterium]|nr:hypothetical protein [Chthoniobacterales bacterium]
MKTDPIDERARELATLYVATQRPWWVNLFRMLSPGYWSELVAYRAGYVAGFIEGTEETERRME